MDADSYRLPHTPNGAWLEERYIRCGKPCRCLDGQPHGGYWRLCWREEGRRQQRYLAADDVPAYREAVEWRRRQAVDRRAQLRMADAALAHARQLLRSVS